MKFHREKEEETGKSKRATKTSKREKKTRASVFLACSRISQAVRDSKKSFHCQNHMFLGFGFVRASEEHAAVAKA